MQRNGSVWGFWCVMMSIWPAGDCVKDIRWHFMEFREKLLTFFSLVNRWIISFFSSGKSDISMSFVLAMHIYSFLGMSQSCTGLIYIFRSVSDYQSICIWLMSIFSLICTLLMAIGWFLYINLRSFIQTCICDLLPCYW